MILNRILIKLFYLIYKMTFISKTFWSIASVAIAVSSTVLIATSGAQATAMNIRRPYSGPPSRAKFATWNVQNDINGLKESFPMFDLYATQDKAPLVPRDQDVVALQEVWNNTDAVNYLNSLADDYPYYYRPGPAPYVESLCDAGNPEDEEDTGDTAALEAVFNCFAENEIEQVDLATIGPCAAQLGALGGQNPNCLNCFVVQALRASLTAFRQQINTGFMANITDPNLAQVVFGNCLLAPQCATNGYNTVDNAQDNDGGFFDQTVYKRNLGQLILSKKPLRFYNGSVMPLGVQGESSKAAINGLVEDRVSGATTYVPSIPVQRGFVSLNFEGLRFLAVHLPFDFGIPLGVPLQKDIMQIALQKEYDLLLGDFNSGGEQPLCRPLTEECKREGYQSAGYDYIVSQGYARLQQKGDRQTLDFEASDEFGYGSTLPKGGSTFCHNDRLQECADAPEDEWMLDIDHIFINKNSRNWVGRPSFGLNHFAQKGDNQLSDHVGLKCRNDLRYR